MLFFTLLTSLFDNVLVYYILLIQMARSYISVMTSQGMIYVVTDVDCSAVPCCRQIFITCL